MSLECHSLSEALESPVVSGDTRWLGRIFKVPVALTPNLERFLCQAVRSSQRPGAERLVREEVLQAAAKAARTLAEARRVSYRVALTCGDTVGRDVDLMAALVSPAPGESAVQIGLAIDFLPKRQFIVRLNCEYSIAIEAVDEADALMKAEFIPTLEWARSWSCREAEAESEVCDACRSYGPQSKCDCRR